MIKPNEVLDLLNLAKENGISVYKEGVKLKFKVAKNKTIKPEMIELLRSNKEELLSFLGSDFGDTKKVQKVEERITPVDRSLVDKIPLSFSQERLWFIDQFGGSLQYHLPTILRLRNELDRFHLEAALSDLIQRHEVLRTVIKAEGGQAFQSIIDVEHWKLKFSEGPEFKDEAYLSQFIQEEINRPFDLSADYMLRAHLIKCGENDHVLMIVMHHIASDGWSNSILVKDLIEFYAARQEGKKAKLVDLPIQYSDYAFWQRTKISDADLSKELDWWEQRLQNVQTLELPTDYPRPAVQSTNGSGIVIKLNARLTQKLKELSAAFDTTFYMTMLTAFNILMSKYTGQNDISVGTPLANRNQKELESLVGFFINTLVLRNDLSGNPSFATLLQQVKGSTLDYFDHQNVPFEQIVERVSTGRSLSQNPLFQVMFILQNAPETPSLALGDLSMSNEPTERKTTLFDLIFSINETQEECMVKMIYCVDLFSEATIRRMAIHFEQLLESIVAEPHRAIQELSMLKREEEKQLLIDFNNTKVDYPQGKSVIDLFEAQVLQTPNDIALCFENTLLTYQELNEKTNQMARHLVKKAGVKQGDSIGVMMDRSEWSVISMLGILKVGAVYLPIDSNYPSTRLQFLLTNSEANTILVNGQEKNHLIEGKVKLILDLQDGKVLKDYENHNVNYQLFDADPIALFYTSGSTGTPKGVIQTHLMYYNLVMWTLEKSDRRKGERYLLYSSLSFDLSLYDVVFVLSSGGSLYLNPDHLTKDLWGLKDYILHHKIANLSMPFSVLKILFDEFGVDGFQGHSLTEILSTGEQLYINGGLRIFLEKNPDIKIYNVYGPSETHCITEINYSFSKGNVPVEALVGQPLSNTKLYLLDAAKQLLPMGLEGEIYVEGHGLALGYKNNAKETADKFIDHPFKLGEKVYKTGDIGKWLPDGSLAYRGRKDKQIKLNGYRIELGEIETTLESSPTVKNGAVMVKESNGVKQLIAYVVPETTFDKIQLKQFMAEALPDYMVPSYWVELDQLPLNENGKLDRKALPDSQFDRKEYIAPRNEAEQMLFAIWTHLLGLKKLSVRDNFFEIGGHSLLAMRVISAIRKEWKKELKVKDIFFYPTIEGLAKHLMTNADASQLPSILSLPRPDRIPLSYAQERLWFVDQLGGSVQYHMPTILRLKNILDKNILEASLKDLIDRHEVLRSIFVSDEKEVYQKILAAENWTMGYSEGATFADQENLSAFIYEETIRPFDLSKDFMLRAHLVKCGTADHVLILVMHHIASDGWSNSILVKDLVEIYAAKQENCSPALAQMPIQYADYAIWQRKYMSGDYLETQLNWWEQQLNGVQPLAIPTDYPRPAIQSTNGENLGLIMDKEMLDGLNTLSVESGTTLFMTLLAVLKILLYRYSGETDICIGTALANRNDQAIEPLVGFFVNTLALRSDLGGNPNVRTLLKKIKQNCLEAYAHQEVPFEQIVNRVEVVRDRSRSPIYQVSLGLQNKAVENVLELGELDLSHESSGLKSAVVDLTFSFVEHAHGLQLGVAYCKDLFSPATIQQMTQHFKNLLESVVAHPDQAISSLSMLSLEEEQELLVTFNDTFVKETKNGTLVELFEEQVARVPHKTALVHADKTWTYQALNEQANQLANHLKSTCSIQANDMVGLLMDRSDLAIVAILGIMKTGAAYVPIDPKFPQERKDFILEDTGLKTVLLSTGLSFESKQVELNSIVVDEAFLHEISTEKKDLAAIAKPSDLAYVIYTSGSTGKPKGVMIEHQNIRNTVVFLIRDFGITEEDHTIQFASLSFDASVWEIFAALLSGAKLHIVSDEVRQAPQLFEQFVADQQISFATLPPTYLNELEIDRLSNIKTLVTAGEAANQEKAEAFAKIGNYFNAYGPTESSICASIYKVNLEEESRSNNVPIGRPNVNTQLYILDAHGNLVPKGVSGELCISGNGLARGYLNRPELTAEKFVAHPFLQQGQVRMYKTGDLAKWKQDGNIEFIGRIDNQVKIRGHRIELGEIENCLRAHQAIEDAIVICQERERVGKELIAYFVPKTKADNSSLEASIQGYLNDHLPNYMIPSKWIELEKIPLTINGKVDKKALPDPESWNKNIESYRAPENEMQQVLANIWGELLELEQVGIDDNFFEIGGHSLLATRIISSIRKELNLELSVGDLFGNPTIDGLSAFLATQEKQVPTSMMFSGERPSKIPVSFSQERLWIMDNFRASVMYHMPTIINLSTEVKPLEMEKAIRALIDRHEILRTVIYSEDGKAYQKINTAEAWSLDYSEGPEFEDIDFLNRAVSEIVQAPFVLSNDYMLRAHMIKVDEFHQILILVQHHIASDGWSTSLLVNDLTQLYQAIQENQKPDLTEMPIQYADYAIWQRNHWSEEKLEASLDWWETQLTGVESLKLPNDYPRPLIQSYKGANWGFQLDPQLTDGVKNLANESGASLFMTMLAIFKVLMYRYSGQDDICVGTPLANRNHKEVESLVGFFINMIALRSQVNDNPSFVDFLQQVKTNTLAAFAHQDVPFEKIVDRVVMDRSQSKTPLFQVMFTLQNIPEIADLDFGQTNKGMDAPNVGTPTSAKYDLTFFAKETTNGLTIGIEYCADLFSAETIKRMGHHFKALIEAVVADPNEKISQLQMLNQAEQAQLLTAFNPLAVDYPKDQTIVDLFEKQVKETPDQIALAFNDQTMTFRELDERSNQLGHFLKAQGIKEEIIVAIRMEPSLDLLVGILGILKSGAAYLPIDPKLPKERVEFSLKDTEAKYLLGHQQLEAIGEVPTLLVDQEWSLVEKYPVSAVERDLNPSNLVYVIYTSGSTGQPKGILIEHRNLINYLSYSQRTYGQEIDAFNFPLFTSISFDLTQTSIFLPLMTGGTLFIQHGDNLDEISTRIVENESINAIKLTPAHTFFFQLEEPISGIKVAIVGGEKLEKNHVLKLKSLGKDIKIFNEYGPTEATIGCIVSEIESSDKDILIGKPIDNTQIFIMDAHQSLVPIGIKGEIGIAGDGLARGYLNRPDLNAEKFIKHPFSNKAEARIYRTGDLACWRADGQIEYLGRTDDQVKVRGYRIELGEIEIVMNQSEEVKSGVVLAKPDDYGQLHLVAFVVTNKALDKTGVQAFLASKLPDYMVPNHWLELTEMPLTNTGKVDRMSLAKMEISIKSSQEFEAPRNEQEAAIAEIWEGLLNMKKVGIYDNFLDIGGNSINAMMAISRMNKALETELTLVEFFANPTIAKISKLLSNTDGKRSTIVALNPTEESLAHFFFIPPVLGNPIVFSELAKVLEGQINAYGFEYDRAFNDNELDEDIEDMAYRFIVDLFSIQESGTFYICGYSMGGIIGFEMTRQLEKLGHKVVLFIMDRNVENLEILSPEKMDQEIAFYLQWFNFELAHSSTERLEQLDQSKIEQRLKHNMQILNEYEVEDVLNAKIIALEAKEGRKESMMQQWSEFTENDFQHVWLEGAHHEMMTPKNQDRLIEMFLTQLAASK